MATQFDIMRDRIARQAKKQQQQLEEKTAQRFALQGNLQSGAYEEAQRQNVQSVQEQAGQQLQEVEAAEQADLARKEEIQKEREFQAGESEKGRQLTREQTAAQQQFAREERIGGQQFSVAENEAMRKFQAGERMSAQDFQALEAARQRQFATQERLGSQQYGTQERIGAEQASARENELQRKFQAGERLSAQDFTELQAMNQRKFQAEQAGMDRAARRQELDDQLAQGKWSEQLRADIQREGIASDALFKQQNLNLELTAMKINAINNIRDTLLQGLSEEETSYKKVEEILTKMGDMVRFKPDGIPVINGVAYGEYAENQTSLQSRPTTSSLLQSRPTTSSLYQAPIQYQAAYNPIQYPNFEL